ncbi:MAG: bile acid:sodium symporter family protein [Thermodesulfobacteriota bacterium]
MELKDLILFGVVIFSMLGGIFIPALGDPFEPFLVYFMIIFLYLSFLRVDLIAIIRSIMDIELMAILLLVKLLAIPLSLYYVTKLLFPSYALPVLLLSGISTGVVAPFISNILAGNTSLVVSMVVLSSLLVPFTLPLMVTYLVKEEIEISLLAMVRLLALIVFIPIGAREISKRYMPRLIEWGEKAQYPVSLGLIACTMLAVFGKYSPFFFREPGQIFIAIAVAFLLSALYMAIGSIILYGRSRENQLAGGISMAFLNNILVLVFSSHFFGPTAATLAAMYILPFFAMIIPIRLVFKVQ